MRRLLRSLKVPIVSAPMAGGINTPHFVNEVVRCGGIGSFGFAYSTPVRIAADLKAVDKKSLAKVNANFFVFPAAVSFSEYQLYSAQRALELRGSPVLFPTLKSPWNQALEQQLRPVWRIRPGMLTFHFGHPPIHVLKRAHDLGMLVGGTATCAAEALSLEAAGVDFVVAQGIEAGGHRGKMNPSQYDEQLSTLALVDALSEAGVKIPMVAAGGIMTGAHIQVAKHPQRTILPTSRLIFYQKVTK